MRLAAFHKQHAHFYEESFNRDKPRRKLIVYEVFETCCTQRVFLLDMHEISKCISGANHLFLVMIVYSELKCGDHWSVRFHCVTGQVPGGFQFNWKIP